MAGDAVEEAGLGDLLDDLEPADRERAVRVLSPVWQVRNQRL